MIRAVIETHGLQKCYGREPVLKGVDLQIEPGQVAGLIGVNGSGKSTLIKCLLGLLRRNGGESRVFGEDSWNLSAQAKSRLGYVSQEFAIYPWMKVQAVCDYTRAFYERWDSAHVDRLLQEWSLPRNKRVGTLSVGQRQKLAVILAMGHRPELLILDEPVASLDPVARRQFLQSLVEFTADERNTILFSTHITSDLERVASHVAFLSQGRLGYWGELDSLKDSCKRLRISADHPLPDDLQVDGTVRMEVHGTYALITVTSLQPETIPLLEERWNARVTVEDLNLEEIFLELNGVAADGRLEAGGVR